MKTSTQRAIRGESFSFGMFLLFVGIVSLLVNFDIITWQLILTFIVTYWPVFIIAAGIKLIGNAQLRTYYFGVLFDLLFYGCILWGLITLKDRFFPVFRTTEPVSTIETVNRSQFPIASSKAYSFQFGAADVRISDDVTNRYAIVSGPKGFSLTTQGDRNSAKADIALANDPAGRILRFSNFRQPERFDVVLGITELPTTFDISLGASKGEITLERSILTEFTSTVGAGDVNVSLVGSAIPGTITLKVGAGKTVLRLNAEDSVKLTYSVGAGSLKLISTTRELNKEFGGIGTSGVYEVVPNPRVNINVSVGAGAVEVVLD